MENIMLNIIDEYLNIEEETKEVWKIKDDLAADYALDKIAEEMIALRRYEITVNSKVSQLQLKLKKEQEKANREIEFFKSKLREYFEQVQDKARETKTQMTYKLPSGVLKMKKEVVALEYDKSKLLEYAEKENLEDLIKVTKDFKWADFKKQLEIKGDSIINKDTGEIMDIDGLSVESKPEIFTVEV